MTPKDFCKWMAPAAYNADISPVFIIAQAALESGWGKSTIGKYNVFGITRGGWPVEKCLLVTTHEYFKTKTVRFTAPEKVVKIEFVAGNGLYKYTCKRLFRNYATLGEALRDHAAVLKKSWPEAWAYRMSPENYVKKIQEGRKKYATAPNYVETMGKMFGTVRKAMKEAGLSC